MHDLLCTGDPVEAATGGHIHERIALPQFGIGGRHAVLSRGHELAVSIEVEVAELRSANSDGVDENPFEHNFQFAGRPADDPQDLRGGGLVLKRLGQIVGTLAQFVEQPRILDGNDRLRGEVLYQLDLLVSKWTNFLAVDLDDADQILFLQHWNGKFTAHAGELNDRRLHRIVHIASHRAHVGYLNHLLGFPYATKAGICGGSNKWRAPSGLSVCGCRTVQGNGAKRISFAEKNDAKLCAAQMFGTCQQGFEHRREFARRT